MSDQRYVVEITRPVPPDRVEQVAERIAARLSLDPERIVTLLDGRTGAVTKPVLADKADAIAEVFAAAGVRVIVSAALSEPPPYQERFGRPLGAVPGGEEPPGAQDGGERPDAYEPLDEPRAEPRAEPRDETRAEQFDEPEDDPLLTRDEDDAPAPRRPGASDAPPWDEAVAWGFDADTTDGWVAPRRDFPSSAGGADPATDDPTLDPEEEADRLGPRAAPGRAGFAPADPHPTAEGPARTSPGVGSASTRWTPSPHDPYAFAPEDAPGTGAHRASPVGPARTTPLAPEGGQERSAGHERRRDERSAIGGFYSPDDHEPPREGPRLRSYLLWALVISLLVLVLLQFVLAARADAGPALGVFETGMLAYRKGDFAAARRVWEPIAEAGNGQAQYLLGFMVQNGLGQPWSNARAAAWYRRAAQQGLPQAQLALGDLYLRGMGVDHDPRVGAAWYASAAVAGDPRGQYEYARLLLHGVGVERDLAGALTWFEAAAANGVAEAADYVAYARAHTGQAQAQAQPAAQAAAPSHTPGEATAAPLD